MELEDIRSLIGAARLLGLTELEVRKNGVTLRLVRDPASVVPSTDSAAPAVPFAAPPVRGDLVAPLSGVLHLSPQPGAPPFVTVGQAVAAGDVLCLIEAMKVFIRVSTERGGVVEAVLVPTGAEIEAGQVLMRIV
jgi:acetyl-CoA carboxylase biotin carboxyl carrier protein